MIQRGFADEETGSTVREESKMTQWNTRNTSYTRPHQPNEIEAEARAANATVHSLESPAQTIGGPGKPYAMYLTRLVTISSIKQAPREIAEVKGGCA